MSVLTTEFVRSTLKQLLALTAERAGAEAKTQQEFNSRTAEADRKYDRLRKDLQTRLDAEREAAEQTHSEAITRLDGEFASEQKMIDETAARALSEAVERHECETERITKEYQESA